MARFYQEQTLDHDANLALAQAAEARRNGPKRKIVKISEARSIAQKMLRESEDAWQVAICWNADEGAYHCLYDSGSARKQLKNVVERVYK